MNRLPGCTMSDVWRALLGVGSRGSAGLTAASVILIVLSSVSAGCRSDLRSELRGTPQPDAGIVASDPSPGPTETVGSGDAGPEPGPGSAPSDAGAMDEDDPKGGGGPEQDLTDAAVTQVPSLDGSAAAPEDARASPLGLSLIASVPSNGATNVSVETGFTLTFDGPIRAGSGAIVLFEVFDTLLVEEVPARDARAVIDGNSVHINWNTPLGYSNKYGVVVQPDALIAADGKPFVGVADPALLAFTTQDPAPIVLRSSTPTNGATNVPIAGDIELTFSGEVVAGAIGDITLLKASSGEVVHREALSAGAGATISGPTLTFRPDTALDYSTRYQVALDEGAVHSAQGGAAFTGLEEDALSFTTEGPPTPELVSTSPADDSLGVDPASKLVLTFDQPIIPVAGTISVRESLGDAIFETIDVTSSAVTIADVSITVSLSTALANATAYYVNVSAGAVKGQLGGSFGGLLDKVTFSFTTATAPPPPLTLLSAVPVDDAVDVAADTNIALTFSGDIVFGSGSVAVVKTLDDQVVESIPASDPRMKISGATVTINPVALLADNTQYYITIGAGTFQSVRGAAFPGVLDPSALNFDTDNPFVVTELTPADDAVGVALEPKLSLKFSANVERDSGDLKIFKGDGTLVETIPITSAGVTVSGTTLTAVAAAPLGYDTAYYVTLGSGAISEVGGNAFGGISGSTTWNFTTVAACDEGEVRGSNGNCYFASASLVTWAVAREACNRGPGWDLATIRSAADQSFLEGIVSTEMWIGANDLKTAGDWIWVTDELKFWNGNQFGGALAPYYSNFKSDQPTGDDQHCVRILGITNDWLWADALCDDTYGFLCEGPPN